VLDEMFFTVMVSIFFIGIVFYFDNVYSTIVVDVVNIFGEKNFVGRERENLLTQATST